MPQGEKLLLQQTLEMAKEANGILDKKMLISLIGSRLTADVEKQRCENVRDKFE